FARLSAVVTLGDGRTIGGNAITPVAVVGNCSGGPTAPPPDVPPLPPPDIPPMGPMFPDTPTTSPTQVIDMVRNKPLGEAVVILMDRGFRAGAITERPDPNVPKGNVITGSLSVDTPNFIDLVVSSGSLVFSSELHLRCDTQKKTASFPLCFNLRNSPCRTQGETVVCRVPTDVDYFCDAEKRFNGEARPTGVKQLRCGL
ncbi:MAG TPA: hypothetical protein VJR89_17845, partial [Polyangiales bacterium]|nr:hypothetical protein [Polyangiales bacterium]